MTTSLKPICPRCDRKITRRKRINGKLCCPRCRKPVHEINGFFSTEERPPLSIEIWEHFVLRVSIKEGLDISEPEGSPSWIRELGFAISLLKKCDGDIDLALGTIDQFFQHKRLGWTRKTSLLHCLTPDFRLAQAAAKKVIGRQRDEEKVVSRNVPAIQVSMPSF